MTTVTLPYDEWWRTWCQVARFERDVPTIGQPDREFVHNGTRYVHDGDPESVNTVGRFAPDVVPFKE